MDFMILLKSGGSLTATVDKQDVSKFLKAIEEIMDCQERVYGCLKLGNYCMVSCSDISAITPAKKGLTND